MPEREDAWATVRLYDLPSEDLVTDPGFGWLDFLAVSWAGGTFSRNSRGVSYLEYLAGIGLVCRPFLNLKDTRSSHYTTTGGAWEERRPIGGDRFYRLHQYSAAAGAVWSAESTWSAPANPSFAFTIVAPQTPPDWDGSTYPPFVRVEWGTNTWGVEFNSSGAFLMRYVSGAWRAVAEIPNGPRGFDGDEAEALVFVRCHRGRVGVSMDLGRSYVWAGDDLTPVSVSAGKVTVRGQGGCCAFGLHQLAYISGTFDSIQAPTGKVRGVVVPTITARSLVPTGTLLAFTDLGSGIGAYAKYRATLTPATHTATPFMFYSSPELYTVTYRLPVVTFASPGTYTEPWNDLILGVEITKPFELDAGTCTLRLHWDPLGGPPPQLRRRKLMVECGWTMDDATEETALQFVCYVRSWRVVWDQEWGASVLEIQADQRPKKYKRKPWSPFDVIALGGQSVNSAADLILYTEGEGAASRIWHAAGNALLPAGSPENPCELIRPREFKWETKKRIFGLVGLEVGVTDLGVLFTVPKDYVAETPSRPFHAQPVTDLQQQIEAIDAGEDYDESATAALVTGTLENGVGAWRLAIDTEAEGNALADQFNSWGRELVQDDLGGTCSPGLIAARAQALAAELFPIRRDVSTTSPVDPSLSRRDRVPVHGCAALGIPDGAECVVLTLRHSFKAGDSLSTLKTVAGLWKLPT